MNETPPTAPITSARPNEFIIKSQKALIDTYAWQCCLNCEEYTKTSSREVKDQTKYSGFRIEETGPKCMKYDMLPPPDVMVCGCVEWMPVIPF